MSLLFLFGRKNFFPYVNLNHLNSTNHNFFFFKYFFKRKIKEQKEKTIFQSTAEEKNTTTEDKIHETTNILKAINKLDYNNMI